MKNLYNIPDTVKIEQTGKYDPSIEYKIGISHHEMKILCEALCSKIEEIKNDLHKYTKHGVEEKKKEIEELEKMAIFIYSTRGGI